MLIFNAFLVSPLEFLNVSFKNYCDICTVAIRFSLNWQSVPLFVINDNQYIDVLNPRVEEDKSSQYFNKKSFELMLLEIVLCHVQSTINIVQYVLNL